METYEPAEAAQRIGVSEDELHRFVELGILTPDSQGQFNPGHLRRAGLVNALAASGIPLDGLGEAVRSGQLWLDFLDAPAFERFSALSGETFGQVAERTGVPIELLLFIREAAGSAAPGPDDRIRDEELPYVDLIELEFRAGFRPAAIQQNVRTQGDSLRRVAETESAMWVSEVIETATRAGKRPDQMLGDDFGDRNAALAERAMLAMYRLQQARAWTAGIIDQLEIMLAARRTAQPARASACDVLPRHHRVHAAHPGAGRRGRCRSRRDARPSRPADLGPARGSGRSSGSVTA